MKYYTKKGRIKLYLKIVITGSRRFSLLANEAIDNLKIPEWVKLEVNEQPIESLVEENELKLEQIQFEPATIIISGEQSAKNLEKKLNMIVVPVKINENDVLVSLTKNAPEKHIAIINYRTRFENIDYISNQLNLNISQYSFQSLKGIRQVFEEIKKKNINKIIGGSYACEIADFYGIESEFLYSEGSLREAIKTAVKFLEIYRNEMEQAALFKTIASVNKSGIISINGLHQITSINKIGEELFGLSKEIILGKSIEEWIDKNNLVHAVDGQQPIIFNVNDLTFAATLSPVFVASEKIGAILVVDDVKEIQKKEIYIRSRINSTFKAQYHFTEIIGSSKNIELVKKTAKKFSRVMDPILIQGESGTGKELFAQSIHNASDRSENSFVAINCAAIPENLLDSELFGYEEGAFTGAKKGGKKGLFELAHKGTIFLDEIDSVPLHLQSKLLRVLQEKEIMRIGGDKVIPIDIRIISATNKELMETVQDNKFREDLYYRISVLQLVIPPLRERKEDIEEIAKKSFSKLEESVSLLTRSVLELLQKYPFPGNVRELENVLARFKVYCTEEKLNESTIHNFMIQALSPGRNISFNNTSPLMENLNLKEQEHLLIESALLKHNGRKDLAAKELGISRATLWRKLNDE
jgi:propionate catabolism operon transcriptional regulator